MYVNKKRMIKNIISKKIVFLLCKENKYSFQGGEVHESCVETKKINGNISNINVGEFKSDK